MSAFSSTPASTSSMSPSWLVTASSDRQSDPGGYVEEWSSFIGIITAIVGNILISFALNIQRYAHVRIARGQAKDPSLHVEGSTRRQRRYHGLFSRQESAEDEENPLLSSSFKPQTPTSTLLSSHRRQLECERKSYLRSPYWWTGIVLMILGETGNFLAYGFAPASIVSPLGVIALISNCVIAPIMLKESFRRRDFWGVLIAIGGAVTVVLSAPHSEEKIGPSDIWNAISRWEFEAYLGIVAFMIILLTYLSGIYGDRVLFIDVGLVALFGGLTALSTKGLSSLVSDTLWRVLLFPISYLLAAVLVISAVLQIRYINRALQRFSATQVIPTQFVFFTLSVIIGSAVLYRDFEKVTESQAMKFVGGCAMTFVGVWLITSGRPSTSEDETASISSADEERGQNLGVADSEGRTSKPIRYYYYEPGKPLLAWNEQQLLPPSSAEIIQNHWTNAPSFRTPDPFWPSTPRAHSSFATGSTSASHNANAAASSLPRELHRSRISAASSIPVSTFSRLIPGPLTSPLPGSSLSAVVAESLRRGVQNGNNSLRTPKNNNKTNHGRSRARSSADDAAEAANSEARDEA